jgi:hypothetical protein
MVHVANVWLLRIPESVFSSIISSLNVILHRVAGPVAGCTSEMKLLSWPSKLRLFL